MKSEGSAPVIAILLTLGIVAAAGTTGLSYKDHHERQSNERMVLAALGARGATVEGSESYPGQSTGTTQAWTQTSSLPEPLETQAAAVNNGFLYIIGGLSKGTPTSSVLYSKIDSDGTLEPFQETTPLPYTLYRYLCGVVNNNFIYAIGGIADGSTTSSVLYAPILGDGTVGQWTPTTSLPEPLQLHGTVANNGYLYVIGGSTAPVAESGQETNAVAYAEFNPDGTLGPFTPTTDLPVADYKTCPVADHGAIYLLGGEVPESTSAVWYALPAEDGSLAAWNAATPLPYTNAATAIVNSDGAIVMMGGDTSGTGADTSGAAKGRLLGLGTIQWHLLPALPKVTSRQAGASYDGYVYSIGGLSPNVDTSAVYFMRASAK